MKQDQPISSAMSKDVVTVSPNDKISKIKRLMRDLLLHHIPVVENQKLVGMISRVDVLRASFSNQLAGADESDDECLDHIVNITDIMSKDVITVKDSDSVRHTVQILSGQEFNALPVINDQMELIGIVTSKDIIEFFVESPLI